MNRTLSRVRILATVVALLFGALPGARAQWQTQSFTLKPGWNAVFLHVDASHVGLDSLISGPANPIAEVWLWQPSASSVQFTTTPQQPSAPNSQWAVWDRSPVVADSLTSLIANHAYLVRNTNTVDYVWTLKGQPVPPDYQWTSTGLNFIGFPTPAVAAPDFDTFLVPAPELQRTAEIYRYPGGDLGPNNPTRVFPNQFRSTPARRGEAVWIRSGTAYNRYFGPIEVNLQDPAGIHFGDSQGVFSVRLRNITASAQTVTLSLLPSEAPPAGQPAITATPASWLLVRGALNPSTLTYDHTALTGPKSFTLAAQGQIGSELEVVLGLNRSVMSAPAGSGYASILRFADTGGLSQIDVPVTASVADTSGLWVGGANVTRVGQYLKTYVTDGNGQLLLGPVGASGQAYLSSGTNTALTAVARPFPLRLIVHHNAATALATLLQRVYVGIDPATNAIVTTQESQLSPAAIGSARRISATHLPFSHENDGWPRSLGKFQLGTNLVFNVLLDPNDQASNPFLHTFHPDHDNLQSDFRTVEPQGVESYGVNRQITLTFTEPAADFASLTAGTDTVGGSYSEVITFRGLNGQSRAFTLTGVFTLNRVSPISTLTQN
ncbi:MAG: hypothetical protein RIS76_2490 [Verrucomicrobiota bacterium]